MTLINSVYEIAAAAHAGQTRKHSSIPYIIHPLRVADAIGRMHESLTAAAVLHDVLEDAPKWLVRGFETRIESLSPAVLSIVKELTRADDPTNTTDKEAYLASFAGKSVNALIIKLFDRYDNVADFARTSPGYAPKYAQKASTLYQIVIDRENEVAAYAGATFANRMAGIATMLAAYGSGRGFKLQMGM
jgi:guanosine-3',5'-bis(diphosphate) 3'-pyrophosphohydrolase